LLQIDLQRFEKAESGSEMALELFPAQPIFYLLHGVSLVELQKGKNAIETLTTGIDYVIDDQKMEADFYIQISKAYEQQGDPTKALEFQEKANELQKKS